MTRQTISMTDNLYQYYLANSLREDPILNKLRVETSKLSTAKMQIAPEEGQFLAFLIKLLAGKKAIDIGVFTGYSSLVVAMAMSEQGKVIACDINEEWTRIAKKYWQLAGQETKIDLKLAPAVQTLKSLIADGQENTFDFIFIDADKKSYIDYYELSLKLLRPGGVIAVDNVLWGGRIADPSVQDEDTLAIRKFNDIVVHDSRISMSMLPIADGLTLVLKK
jgi:predicted O-methyltransferase YrrM